MTRAAALLVNLPSTLERRLGLAFETAGAEVLVAEGPRQALEKIRTQPVSVLAAPHEQLAGPGTDLASRATRVRPQLVLLAVGDVEAEERERAFRSGMFEVLAPGEDGPLSPVVARVLMQAARLAELQRLRDAARARAGVGGLVGRSDVMRRVREEIVRLASGDGAVVLSGEPGTGREHGARLLHSASRRASGPFLVVDARSGAQWLGAAGASRRPAPAESPWERAEGGTLFLRDVSDWGGDIQERLAATIGAFPSSLGPRLVAACGIYPDRMAETAGFSAALRAAFGDAVVVLPPLRDRAEDVPLLARHFLEAICEMNELAGLRLSREATEALVSYRWPGNVRELRAAVEHAALVSEGSVIRPRDLPEPVRRSAPPTSGVGGSSDTTFRDAKRDVVDRFEREYLEGLLERFAGNVTEAASASGMMRSALQRLLRKHRIRSSGFRSRGTAASGSVR